jgi:eukaryotic-like serine/threonine-protein kinase
MVCRATRLRRPDGNNAGEEVALKLYHNPAEDARVQREIDTLQGYRHPNLAVLVEDGRIQIRGQAIRFVAWEFVPGEALDRRISRAPVPPRVVAAIGRDAARAIDYIWRKRIVHRDVNPKNILLRAGETEAVLIDLGIAKHLDLPDLTARGIKWGTIGYFSPEQWRGEQQLTCSSDVFSLAVALQETLISRHPTNRDQGRLYSNPPRTADLDPNIPAGLAMLLDEMLRSRAPFRPHPAIVVERFAELAARL